ncbi:5-deoxy-glucuronate isomerase [Verminephrobacter aporrectodeae]|uniref:5-deoxy-glucuronate isomerase n=1 Tax=Verminephrobacter aporrectodeae subsp. tuberculatae TaxID=1110392 RepID=A0ABT3KYH5_9BURK|nr:5-deoxy-glucuronate isomerase [Verminephrobacter aporrectodeae]MCW5323400.1 5-deoxy-glucuronate isomerase [Verminephrobacter aporrectodeae subsp. tuberculatae]MCW8175110.1 5-deoxy-glucuronate isomerase [Verminephrobacter aporrectodeae subsp. tuberculatae]MCW8202486.1 5-deoxy-glucuronate isomerase [Verminephrobacter aporrectodeae subsp. tuberculatae]MCW8206645.1 5-deoxy-glucuronate isomerase [Verminephrobacter aporrectodeae subsp. tuberculatae]
MPISPLLIKAAPGREICCVTPASAGWQHVGFRALRLGAGEHESLETGARELCVVVLTGSVDVQVGGQRFAGLGKRDSVFEEISPDALYLPGGQRLTITATRAAEVALCSAPCVEGKRPVCRIDGAGMRRSTRGAGSNARHVCDILMGDNPAAERLLVVEVITPAGHSSSYPPHKHDRDAAPDETLLEETYYHRLDPPQGFAFQRVYTDDRSLDEACAVENHDVVLVPRGYHPVVAPHGYRLYYLNVMAGPGRTWVFRNDPAHEWMLHPAASGPAQKTRP